MKPVLSLFVLLALVVSPFHAKDLFTWFMEVVPIFVVAPLLWFTRRGFPLTDLLSVLIALHCLVLIVGGHYTYAEVPPGFWMEHAFGLTRNHYDRIGHFMQGLVPALAMREFLLRQTVLKPGLLVSSLCVCLALAVSAIYEIFEMIVAMATGEAADSFLGTQGDPWDTQMDMSFAFIGAIASLLLSRFHDRQLAIIKESV